MKYFIKKMKYQLLIITTIIIITKCDLANMTVTNVTYPINCLKYFRGTYQFDIFLVCSSCSIEPSIEEDIILKINDGDEGIIINATCKVPIINSTKETKSDCRLTSKSSLYPINLIEQIEEGEYINITVPSNISNIKTNTDIGVTLNIWKTSFTQYIDNIINTDIGRLFTLFFDDTLYKGNITSLIVTNETITLDLINYCNISGSQLICYPKEKMLFGNSRRPKDFYPYKVYYNDSCGFKDTNVILYVNFDFFLTRNFKLILLFGFFIVF